MTDSTTECVVCGHVGCSRGRGKQTNHRCPVCPREICWGYLSRISGEAPPPSDPESADARWPVDPPAWWLEAWAAGWLAGHATGYEHGVDAGYAEYGADLAAALKPMRRAAAHGIDVALAREAWANQRGRGGGQDA